MLHHITFDRGKTGNGSNFDQLANGCKANGPRHWMGLLSTTLLVRATVPCLDRAIFIPSEG